MTKHYLALLSVLFLSPFSDHAQASGKATAILAGGCFWCMEAPFEKLKGVSSVVSGYTGGTKVDPKYDEVSAGGTGHIEAVEITFDPSVIAFDDILKVFWRQIDPTDSGGQFVDRGQQYSSAIFYLDENQKIIATKSKESLAKSGRFKKPLATEIRPATKFYPAEDYHQDFYKKSTLKYKYYRYRSGRDQFLDSTWGKDRDVPSLQ